MGELAPDHISEAIAIKLYYNSWQSGSNNGPGWPENTVENYKLQLKVENERIKLVIM